MTRSAKSYNALSSLCNLPMHMRASQRDAWLDDQLLSEGSWHVGEHASQTRAGPRVFHA